MAMSSDGAVRRLALARAISLTGSAAAFAALNFLIYEKTQSPAWIAAAMVLTWGTGGIAALFAGSLGDRFDRKRVMVLSDLGGALAFGAMAFISDPGWLLAVAFLSALAESPFLAASAAAIPNLVKEERLGWANGLLMVGRNVGIIVGPLIGGTMIAAFGAGAVFGMNALSFLVSAGLVWSVRGTFSSASRGDADESSLTAGVRFVARDRVLRAMALALIPIQLGQGLSLVADVPLVTLFGVGALGYGALIAFWGFGSIIGSVASRFMRRRIEPIVFAAGSITVTAMCLFVGLSPVFVGVLAAVCVMGFGEGTQSVAQQSIMQRRTPDAVRSRVAAAIDACSQIAIGLAFIAAGPVVAWLGPRGTYVFGGLVGLLSVLALRPVLAARREVDAGTVSPPADPIVADPTV
jgi:MFS family permease